MFIVFPTQSQNGYNFKFFILRKALYWSVLYKHRVYEKDILVTFYTLEFRIGDES